MSGRRGLPILSIGSEMKKSKQTIEERPYFYEPDILANQRLGDEEANHAFRVLRLKAGDEVYIADGRGHLYRATLVGSSVKESVIEGLQLIEELQIKRPRLELAIAPTKNIERIELALEKLTEVGLERLSLVITDRTIRRKVNMERLERVMVSAIKQSEKLSVVELRLFGSMKEYLQSDLYEGRYIGYCGEQAEKRYITELFQRGKDSSFLIGPEGDFTPDEVVQAIAKGFHPVALGDERLRTETAGIYAGILHHVLNSK